MDSTPPPPVVSPDGRFYLKEGTWTPLPSVHADSLSGLRRFAVGYAVMAYVFPVALVVALVTVDSTVHGPARVPALIATLVALLAGVGLACWRRIL